MFFKEEPKPARLNKKQEKDPIIMIEDLLVRISVILFIILLFLIFFIICFLLAPPTYGFLWW